MKQSFQQNQMIMADKVAVVTGSNKGIGFGIVRELCRRGVGIVYLTSRDTQRGLEAIEQLKNEGLNPYFHQLDVTDKSSIRTLAEHIKEKHGGLDILINNAGISEGIKIPNYEEAKLVIDTNYRSVQMIQEFLFPLLKDNARVVNVSSDCGHISNIKNPYWVKELTKEDITLKDIDAFIDWFLNSIKNGTFNEDDWAQAQVVAYRVAKIAVCILTRIQQREVGRGISVNSMHPGLVKTDMTLNAGDWTIEEASKTPAYLALDIDQSVKGKYFWFDKTEKDWFDTKLDLYFRVENLISKLNK